MSAILQELLRVSEKAAHIARACRQQDALFQLLIEEKKGGEKNKKFAVDFKTLADVLVQEVIKRHMESKFPGLEDKIFGEESNEFTNALGEMIVLRLCPTEGETAELLSKVLNGNQLAAGALAKVIHEDVAFADPALDSVQVTIPHDTLGIWVDPIDSTHQYIQGSADVEPSHGIFPRGLPCVTILIGVYDLRTGLPLMGVINQPFVSQDPDTLRLVFKSLSSCLTKHTMKEQKRVTLLHTHQNGELERGLGKSLWCLAGQLSWLDHPPGAPRLRVRAQVRAQTRANPWMHQYWNNKRMFLCLPLARVIGGKLMTMPGSKEDGQCSLL
ncbi:inositol polyphosphate 1-phosphatase isoform X3 [Myotis myotis]|uniref:inositol polyphosphate 1-phosphatase isoform X3 n=1 Tax=Myotis myotis TaxID=51298 RepID=UPI00174AC192|nr:inositol polyphosphate 1-phosphatase isoform X3 [Myotis myotis]